MSVFVLVYFFKEHPLSTQPIAVVVLAAGAGTRMKSHLQKTLHVIGGRSLLSHSLHSAAGITPQLMQVEKTLMSMPEVGQNYLIVLERDGYLDQMRVKVEIKNEFFVEDMRELKQLQERIGAKLRDELLITPRVDLVESNSLPKSEGKAQRVQDLRS